MGIMKIFRVIFLRWETKKYEIYVDLLVISVISYDYFSLQQEVKKQNFLFIPLYSAFQIDELHPHNQNPIGTFLGRSRSVVYRHENYCK